MLHNSIYMKQPEQASSQKQKVDPWIPGAGEKDEVMKKVLELNSDITCKTL